MTTPSFFALLRRHVAPRDLETLMTALSVFNAGRIAKADLLQVAHSTLRLPKGAGGAPPVPDLVRVFESLILGQ